MSQHDFDIANQGFPATRADLNNALQALASNSSGATEPTTTYDNQFWYDSANQLLKFRNAADSAWITFAYLDQTNNEWELRSAVIQAVDSAGVVIKTDEGTTRLTIADDGTATFAGAVTVNGNITVTGTVDGRDVATDGTKLDGIETAATADQTGAEIKSLYEAESDTNAYTDAEQTKVGHISVTQAVDLDQMETDIAALANGMVYKGDWDASAGTFPGGGSAQTGWFYYVTVAGTVDSVSFNVGDNIVATTDNASSSTYAANWSKHDQTDAVQSVVGLTGSISKAGLLSALNVEDGADVTDTANVTAAGALMDSELTNESAVKGINQALTTTSNVDFGDVTLAGVLKTGKGADVASAAALTLGTDGNVFDVTGTTAITSIATWHVGGIAILQFDGVLTLTHHATDLILPGGANIVTAAGDTAIMQEYASGDWRCVSYQRAANAPGGGISNIVEDLTPQLGGNLDAQGYNLTNIGSIRKNGEGADRDISGVAAVWVNWNQTDHVADDSFNVSSITDIGVGLSTVYYTNAMANAEYAASFEATPVNNNHGGGFFDWTTGSSASQGTVRHYENNANYDATSLSLVVTGDLA